jgi:hypothetical protein
MIALALRYQPGGAIANDGFITGLTFGERCTHLRFAMMKPSMANETSKYNKTYIFIVTILLFQDAYYESSLQTKTVVFSLPRPNGPSHCWAGKRQSLRIQVAGQKRDGELLQRSCLCPIRATGYM